MSGKNEDVLQIGWGSKDITPDRPVNIAGLFHMRISKGVRDPVTVTAMAMSSGGPKGQSVVFVSCDRPSFRDKRYEENTFLRRCHAAVLERAPGIKIDEIVLNATHTHTAPNTTIGQYEDVPEGVMTPEEYMEVLLNGIAEAVAEAWHNRTPGGVSWGLGTAVVGHNRRATYSAEAAGEHRAGIITNGYSRMYGNTNDPAFSHIEGYEDHYADLFYTWDRENNLTGVVVNIACPSQESQNDMYVSADFWHEVRQDIRSRLGEHIQVLVQCSAAGDQSPTRLWYSQAENRMLKLRGLNMRQEIGRRVARTVTDVMPAVRQDIRTNPVFRHVLKTIDLPRRIITEAEMEQVARDLEALEARTERDPSDHAAIKRCRRVLRRYEIQRETPFLPTQLHAVRVDDIAFVTNRFELFLDYGIRIKARSPAVQTFVIQLAADHMHSGTYLPTERAAANKGYGGSVLDNEVGPEGGQMIVEETLKALHELWAK